MHSDTVARIQAPGGLIAERYRLLGPLGAGASATVWAAVDETLGRQVALKLLSGPAAFDAAEREQLRGEARALAALAHPRVIVVFDYLETPGVDVAVQPVLVTELLDGRDLATCLEDGPLPWPAALGVCGQLAEALAAAHQAGIVHRDVAPANVMLTESGVKLLDFGIAQGPANRGVSDGMAVGTPVCMAPEQLIGHGAMPASDMYAFGCVLYWCLTGRPPYQDKDMARLGAAHLRAAPPPLPVPGLPRSVIELYLGCLAKNPVGRPSAPQAVHVLAPYVSAAGADTATGADADAAPVLDADATLLLPTLPADLARAAGSDADADEASGTPTSHAGRRRPLDRRRVLPVALLLAALAVVAAVVFALADAVTGGGGVTANGANTGHAPISAPSASATAVPAVNLPDPSASASSPAAPASSSPAAPHRLVVGPLPDPAADPIGYLRAVSGQIQALVSQGPNTLQSGAGAQLRGQIANLENAVAAAQQGNGKRAVRAVQNDIAAIEQQISDDAAAGKMSQEAANLLAGEIQRLAGVPLSGD